MKLIVGLGNPGSKYENTRHNVGFMFLDYMAERHSFTFNTKKNYQLGECSINGEKVLLLKPQTFMNSSGEALAAVIKFYKLDNSDIILIYDDLDMEFGKLRVRDNSSSGGHNGIKNIINHIHSQEFMRIKVGIKNDYKRDVKSFVLGKFSTGEISYLNTLFYQIENGCNAFIRGDSTEEIRKKTLN